MLSVSGQERDSGATAMPDSFATAHKGHEIVVIDRRESPSPSAVRVTPEAIRRSVGTGNDLNHVLAADPSVYTLGTIDDNALVVRGGHPGENVYLLDGIELNTISHFSDMDMSGGGLGFVNTDLVSGIDFHKGGGNAAMPSRISSAVDIRLRDKPGSGRHYQVDLNTSGLGATFERGMLENRVYVLSSARWVDTRLFRQWLGDQGTPVFGDGLLKAVLRINHRHTLSALGLFSRDNFQALEMHTKYIDPLQNHEYLYQYAFGLSEKYENSFLRNTLGVSATSMDGGHFKEFDAEMDTVSWVSRRIYLLDYIKQYGKVYDDLSMAVARNARLECGVYGQHSTYFYYNEWNYGRASSCDTTLAGYQAGGYAQGLAEYKGFSAVAGIRADYYSLIDKAGVSPRIEITRFDPSMNHRIWVNGGLYHQLPAQINAILWILYDARDFWIRDLALQRCWEGNLGYEKWFGPSQSIKVETYIKWYDREYPYIAPNDLYFDTSPQFVNGQPIFRISPPDGRKRAYGVELTFKDTDQNRWPYSISGFLSSVKNRYADSSWHNDKNDLQAGVRLTAGRNFGRHHRLTAGFCAMRGRADSEIDSINGYWLYDRSVDYYSNRLSPLFLLNLRYAVEYSPGNTLFRAYVDLINVLNQTPVVDRYLDGQGSFTALGERRLDGFFPVFGLTVQF
jgi:hypothetical protein